MDLHNTSWEPMDIDRSSESVKAMDISFDEIKTGEYNPTFEHWELANDVTDYQFQYQSQEELNNRVSVVPRTCERKRSSFKDVPTLTKIDTKHSYSIYSKIILATFILGLALLLHGIFNVTCTEDFNLIQLKFELLNKVHGQTKAIDELMEALEVKDSKLIIVYGSTGVGKTYAATIVMETFGYTSNLYHYTMPSFYKEFDTDFLLGLSLCKTSLFIIDDLNIENVDIKIIVPKLVNKSKTLEKNLTIMLIYNCVNTAANYNGNCDELFSAKLLEIFDNVMITKKFVKFDQLTLKSLYKCIENEIGPNAINNYDLHGIAKTFNVATDGCKGVHSKIKLINTASAVPQ